MPQSLVKNYVHLIFRNIIIKSIFRMNTGRYSKDTRWNMMKGMCGINHKAPKGRHTNNDGRSPSLQTTTGVALRYKQR
jgi:hypothetical protein